MSDGDGAGTRWGLDMAASVLGTLRHYPSVNRRGLLRGRAVWGVWQPEPVRPRTDNNCYTPDMARSPRAPARPAPPPEVMTISDLAEYLQVSTSSLYKLVQSGRVPGQKVGKHWRFHKDTIDAWLKNTPKTEKPA